MTSTSTPKGLPSFCLREGERHNDDMMVKGGNNGELECRRTIV